MNFVAKKMRGFFLAMKKALSKIYFELDGEIIVCRNKKISVNGAQRE